MAVTVQHHRLATCTLPSSWCGEAKFPDNLKGDTPFIVDVIPGEGRLTVIFGSYVAECEALGDLTFSVNGTSLEIIERRDTLRGHIVELALNDGDADELKVGYHRHSLSVPIVRIDPACNGLNAALLVEIQPHPRNLADWLRYHVQEHGLESLILIRRLMPKEHASAKARALIQAAEKVEGLKQFVLLDVKAPMGQVDGISILDRMSTPDGPGKGDLDPPKPDRYRSFFQELALLEAIRLRLLTDMRAVLMCQLTDLVWPADKSVFDVAANSETYVRFQGRHVYPFNNISGQPKFEDHSCYSFDGSAAPNIWCANAAHLARNPVMRLFRVSPVTPDPASADFGYWRCVAVRFPDLKVNMLAPKASLRQADKLVATMRRVFDADPKLPPAPEEPPSDLKNDKILIVTTMKNEGPFILEWLAYHRSIGVTDFLVYTNDCDDGTDRMFDILQKKDWLTHKENPYRETGEKPQHAAYHDASTTDLAKAADWVICMDVDEYINIKCGDGTLHDLFAAVPDANVISLTWRLFGNAEVNGFEDRWITEQFTRCAEEFVPKPHQAWGFKTLFRNIGHYRKFGVHRPVGLNAEYLDHINWVNGSGKLMPDDIKRTGWRSNKSTYGYDLVSLNHYALRSVESFLVKRDRGRVNHVNRDQGMEYWFRMNNNATEDTSILRNLPRARKVFDELMADPDIRAQHEASVKSHAEKIAELKERPDYLALFEEFQSDRLIELSRHHRLMGRDFFLKGPDTIPDDFLDRVKEDS